jgi:hypothetical protein
MKEFAVNFLLGFCLCFTTIGLLPNNPKSHEVVIFNSDGDSLSTRRATVYETDVPSFFKSK